MEEVGVLIKGQSILDPGQTREGDYRDLIYHISPRKEVGRSIGAFTHCGRVCGRRW